MDMRCYGCKYYDSSVDACNVEDHCVVEGYENGVEATLNWLYTNGYLGANDCECAKAHMLYVGD